MLHWLAGLLRRRISLNVTERIMTLHPTVSVVVIRLEYKIEFHALLKK